MNDHALQGDSSVDERHSHHDESPKQAELNARAMHERTKELQTKREALYRERKKIDVEGLNHYRRWVRCNQQYLLLQKRMENTAGLLVLDANNTVQLQNVSTLLALDTERVNAQLAMTQIQKRLLETQEALKEFYIEGAKLMGIEEEPVFARQMQWFAEQEKREYKTRKDLGEQMLKRAIDNLKIQPSHLSQITHSHLFVFTMADAFFFLGDGNGSWIMTDPPEFSSAGTETSGSNTTRIKILTPGRHGARQQALELITASMDKQKIAHLQSQLNEKLAAFKHEETKLNTNMASWVALNDLSKHVKEEFPEVKDAIDLSSYKATNLLAASKLIMHHDIHINEVMASMKKNYKQIFRLLEEAQAVVDQLKQDDKDNEKHEEVLKALDKPRADWEITIKRMAAIMQRLA
ncbi:hypothetical protein KCU98_g4467, partial [Aureobasidium melanogenum]